MSDDREVSNTSGEPVEQNGPELTEVATTSSDMPVSQAAPARALQVASPDETSQVESVATVVTAVTGDSVENLQREVYATCPSTVPATETSAEAMDVTLQPVTGGDGAICVAEETGDAVPFTGGGADVASDAPLPATGIATEAGSVCDDEITNSSGESAEQSEQLPTKLHQTEPISGKSSLSRPASSSEPPMENSVPEAPSASTDVTMATVDPAPTAHPPAECGGSSSAAGREVAASGALAMLAGYNSDEDGNSDVEVSAAEVGPELTVDREGLYRDSLAAPWSDDSEPDSDSTDDSSDSSSDSESEPAAEIDDKEEEDGETDQARRVFGPMTKGELCLLDLPPIEHLHIALPEEQCTRVGVVTSVVDCLVVVQSTPGSPALDIDSVLFLERGRRPLGRVYDVMGPVAQAAYCVRFNTPQEIDEFDVKPGADVYFAPGSAEYSHFVFVEALRKMRGSDASWWDSNEPPENCLDYSDDEEERNHKRQNRKRPLQSGADSAAPTEDRPARPRPAGRPERGRGRGGGGPACRPPWMPAPPRNPFYGQRGPSAGPPMQWQQHHRPPPPPGPFSRPPPPPPGGFGQPPPPFPGRPPFGLPPGGPPPNQPPPGLPPSGPPLNQPPPPGLSPGGPPPNQPPPWSRPAFWGGR